MSVPQPLPHAPVVVTTALPPPPPSPPSVAEGFPELGGTDPGSLVSATPFDTIDPNITATGASAWRIRYMSTSAVGGVPAEVTGVVLVPGGPAPYDGWHVVAYNHSNTGIQQGCAPSGYDDLANQWGPVTSLLQYGVAVVMTDYEGLGGTGRFAFLDSAALGRNVIDGVRAARHLRPDIGSRWTTFGNSLGGLAAWAANEQAGTYGAGIELVGAVARFPWVNLSALPAKARTGEQTLDQLAVHFQAIMALKATTRPDLDLPRFIHGATYDRRDQLLTCKPAPSPEASEVTATIDPADLAGVDDAAQTEMTDLLRGMAVPAQPMAAPMLVMYAAEDPVVEQEWVEDAIRTACGMGDTIEWNLIPGSAEQDMDATASLPWMRARFDNKAPVNLCPPIPVRP